MVDRYGRREKNMWLSGGLKPHTGSSSLIQV